MRSVLPKKTKRIACFLALTLVFSAITTQAAPGFINAPYFVGTASWYAEFSPGVRPTTANMEIFDHDLMTCAIWGIPFNSILEITNLDNGRRVLVRVNDRGPARRLCREGRVVDLAMRAFSEIADLDEGLIHVKVRIVHKEE